jgi:sugar phosphate isomerase/epimerase
MSLTQSRQGSPKALTNADLVMSYFTLDRRHPIEDRIAIAAAAGFSAIGLYIGEYQRLEAAGMAHGWLDEVLDRHNMWVAEIEVVGGWASPGVDPDRNAAFEANAWEMADRWGCRYLQAIGPYSGTIAEAGDAFGLLCDRARDHGLVVGLEFLPFTNIVDAADAMAIVERAGRDNGGVCVDIWHHARGARNLDLIRALPPEKVMGIQINDGTITPKYPDYKDDCLRDRRPPGEGEFGVVEFVSTLLDMGVTVPWSLEVCSEAAVGENAAAHAIRCANAMRDTLAMASTSRG